MGEVRGTGRQARRRDLALAVLAAVVVLSLALVLAHRNRALSLARAEGRDWAVVNDVVVGFHIDLEATVDAVQATAAARSAGATGPVAGPGIPGASFEALDAGGAPDTGGELTPEDLAQPELQALLARATDTGVLASSSPLDLAAGQRSVLAAAVYAPSGPLRTVDARREAHSGWVVATMDLGAMAAEHLPEGAGARLTVGSRSFVGGAGDPVADVGHTIDLHGYLVDVRAGAVTGPGVSVATWLILLGGAAAALAAGVAVAGLSRRGRERDAALARGEDQAQVIAEVAPIVQHSLDLADVLPAIAVQLRDHFDLAGIHLAAAGASGTEVEVFGLGARASLPPPPTLSPPPSLRAGEATSLALQRGGRGVARLELVAGRDLAAEELRSLRVLTELVTAAVVNANLYASQQDAVRRLRELDALKTVFLSTASHELRTPATAISGFASLLEQRWGDFPEARREEVVGRIAANARSLSAVVEDLLDFSLLDRRDQPLPTVPVDLPELVGGVVDRLSALFVDHTIAVETAALPPIAGDHNGLERVVTNLLTNAAKFSPAGSTITVRVEPWASGGRLQVSDQGPGVAEEERARIFTRFYRGTGEAVVQTRGVGIGLSVVLELVERMDGTVEVDEAPGGGARFTVWLPAVGAGGGDELAGEEGVQDAPAR